MKRIMMSITFAVICIISSAQSQFSFLGYAFGANYDEIFNSLSREEHMVFKVGDNIRVERNVVYYGEEWSSCVFGFENSCFNSILFHKYNIGEEKSSLLFEKYKGLLGKEYPNAKILDREDRMYYEEKEFRIMISKGTSFALSYKSLLKYEASSTQSYKGLQKSILGLSIGETSERQACTIMSEKGFKCTQMKQSVYYVSKGSQNVFFGGVAWDYALLAFTEDKLCFVIFEKESPNSVAIVSGFLDISKALKAKYKQFVKSSTDSRVYLKDNIEEVEVLTEATNDGYKLSLSYVNSILLDKQKASNQSEL